MNRLAQHRGLSTLVVAVLILAGPAIALLAVHDRGWQTLWVLAGMALGATLSGALALLLERELKDRRTTSAEAPTPSGLTPELRERWRVALRDDVIRIRVGEDGQLAKMVLQGDPIDSRTGRVDLDAERPRIRVAERLRPWSEITHQWDAGAGRMVILGKPGYGKTVAALTLIKHINTPDDAGRIVAELFPLAEWQRWRGEHPTAPFRQWLAEQLTRMHPELAGAVARELVDARLVLPVLDGLDEIAAVEDRRACVAAIDSYAERGEPHRPFVLTCRAHEYYELAPDWVRDDERVVLVGLQPDQIQAKLAEPQIAGRPAWDALRHQQATGDAAINELFRSPLRLAIALQVYRDQNPIELLRLPVAHAHKRLWELLLKTNADTYPGATAVQVHAWLAFLAAGMKRTAHERFMLHELYLIDSDATATLRPLLMMHRLAVGLAAGLLFGLSGQPVLGLFVGVAFAWFVTRSEGELTSLFDAAPTAQTHVGWRNRARAATRRDKLILVLVGSALAGLAFGLIGGLTAGVSGAFAVGWMITFAGGFAEGTVVVTAEPPSRFAHAHPNAVLVASRNSGLVNGLIIGLPAGLGIWLALDPILGRAGVGGPLVVVLGSVLSALQWGLLTGLNAWVYHYWLRSRLRVRGLLPARLPAFLDWCACEERGWLRITDAYEFRHHELLEHLAPAIPPAK